MKIYLGDTVLVKEEDEQAGAYHLDVLELIPLGDHVLPPPDPGHVTPIVHPIPILRRLGPVKNEAIHA